MSTLQTSLQTRTKSTAFAAKPALSRAASLPLSHSAPHTLRRRQEPRAAAKPQIKAASRYRTQNSWLILILAVGAAACVIGLLYLSSYAAQTRESYRRKELQNALRAEQEKSRLYDQIKARFNTPASIERRARELHMLPPEQVQPVIL